MSPSAVSSGLSPSLTSTLKMAAVCLASGQSLLYLWAQLAAHPKCLGPCSALLGESARHSPT